MSDDQRSYGPRTTAVLTFFAAWKAVMAAHAAWHALDPYDQQTLLDGPDAPQLPLVSRTLALAEAYGLTLNGRPPDEEEDS